APPWPSSRARTGSSGSSRSTRTSCSSGWSPRARPGERTAPVRSIRWVGVRPTPGRVAVVVIGLLVLAGMALAATRERTVSGYELADDGRVVQVRLTCGSILEGGGVVEVGAPTGIEVPQDERLEEDPGLDCPEEGATWQAGL